MKSRDFCYWLQGMFELSDIKSLDTFQTDKIKKHLGMVFKHEIDPEAGDSKLQEALNALHHTKPVETPAYSTANSDVLIRC